MAESQASVIHYSVNVTMTIANQWSFLITLSLKMMLHHIMFDYVIFLKAKHFSGSVMHQLAETDRDTQTVIMELDWPTLSRMFQLIIFSLIFLMNKAIILKL